MATGVWKHVCIFNELALFYASLGCFGHLFGWLHFFPSVLTPIHSDPRSVKGLNPGFNLYWGSNPEECEWPGRQSVSPFALIGWGAWGGPVCWEDWLSHDENNYFNKILIWLTYLYIIFYVITLCTSVLPTQREGDVSAQATSYRYNTSLVL